MALTSGTEETAGIVRRADDWRKATFVAWRDVKSSAAGGRGILRRAERTVSAARARATYVAIYVASCIEVFPKSGKTRGRFAFRLISET